MYCAQCGYNNSADARFCKNCDISFISDVACFVRINQTEQITYADLRERFFAELLDFLVIVSITIVIIFLIVAAIAITGRDSFIYHSNALPILGGLIFSISIAYFALLESGTQGATFGKRWMNIRIINIDQGTLNHVLALWRLFLFILSLLSLGLIFLLQPFTTRKQALHDMITGTIVIRNDANKKISIMATLLVVFVTLMIPLLALLSTAGLPFLQQHIQRVQVNKGYKIGRQAALAVSRFYLNNGRVPVIIGDALGYISKSAHVSGIDIDQQNNSITVNFSASVSNVLRNKHLIFSPVLQADGRIIWKCHSGDIETRYLPDTCH